MSPARKTARRSGRAVAVLDDFLPPVQRWFNKTFAAPSPAQVEAWPVIRQGHNTLLLAPTGSGKTLATFLSVIDQLFRQARDGILTDTVHALYVTPLKALGNDIHRNLVEPLEGIRGESRGRLPELNVAVRTGDTPMAERQRMIRRPPHILITTPESLYLMLGSRRMADALSTVDTVIVDEVHALCDSKRGVHLSLSLERLAARVRGPLQCIGCSATLSPLDEISRFLVGYQPNGKPRPCRIVDVGMRKDLDIHIRVSTPLPDFLEATNTALWNAAYELLLREIEQHDTTLIFCNSRYKAERTWLRLTEMCEDDRVRIGVHHGSMSRETRLEAEEALKAGELDALVATGSLELGIDIGSVDLVYQLESPKSVATGLQRIGRAGHLLDATSKGRVLAFDRDELMEAAAVCRAMTEGAIDAVHLPRGCLDVLAQQLTGAVAARDWDLDELYELVRQAYPFTDLTRDEYENVLAMLAAEYPFEMKDAPRQLVLWDRPTGRLSGSRSAAHISAMCAGTIADTSEYDVVIARSKKRIGRVQSEFVDDALRIDDVFVLGSSSWRVAGKQRNQLLVEEAPAAAPTVPWWQGGFEARTVEVGTRVGELRRLIAARLDDAGLPTDLERDYHVSAPAARAMVEYVREQQAAAHHVPDHEDLLVETWTDELGKLNLILHCPLGQRLNQAWGQALVTAIRQQVREQWSATVSNDHVVLTRQEEGPAVPGQYDAERLLALVTPATAEPLIRASAEERTGGAPFRHAAVCALQILRGYKGKRVPVWLQNHQAAELSEAAAGFPDYPVFREVRRAFLSDSLNTPALNALLGRIADGSVRFTFRTVEAPSPFVHSLLIQDMYRSEHQMGRDRRAHLLRLHRQVLQEVLSADQLAELLDARAIDELERRLLFTSEKSRIRNPDELAQAIRDLGDVPADMGYIAGMVAGDPATMLEPLLAQNRVVAITLPDCEQHPTRLVAADRWREYHDATARGRSSRRLEVQVPRIRDGRLVDFEKIPASRAIPARWRRKQDPAAAQRAILERHLRCRGPVTLYELADHTGFLLGQIQGVLDQLVAEETVAQGIYRGDKPRPQWVNRANLTEIHRRTMQFLKRELSACAPHEVVDFITRWQRLHPDTRLAGPDGLRRVIGQLQGYEIIQGVLEPEVLAGRVVDYRPEMLERLIASGEVCWRRLHPRRIQRVMITLCFRRDMAWLAAGRPVELDGEATADIDIPGPIVQVREYFGDRATAFFDDVVQDTGLDADVVERAVWHLAWCGEIHCDTYECLRQADFRATLSACYDLATTPRNIVDHEFGSLGWDMSTAKVVARIRKLGMDPRLGRWSITERLAADRTTPERSLVLRSWADQLLKRWGILTRQMLDGEVAAPDWGDLLPELKRRELLGELQRGYFIDHHHGEQYGLPDAIELLRECRGRRLESAPLGYLPDEPLLHLTSREPANLYASSLEIMREDGEEFRRGQKSGNPWRRCVVQAGQVLVYEDRQLVTLEREVLRRCFDLMCADPMGRPQKASYRMWNGYPIAVSPAAAVMAEAGFGLSKGGRMEYPRPRGSRDAGDAPVQGGRLQTDTGAAEEKRNGGQAAGARRRGGADGTEAQPQQIFLPYYQEPPPVEYGPDWTLGLVSDALRPVMAALLERLTATMAERGWQPHWHSGGLAAGYRGTGHVHVHPGKKWIDVRVSSRPVRDAEGQRFHMPGWAPQNRVRVASPNDLDEELDQKLGSLLDRAEEIAAKAPERKA